VTTVVDDQVTDRWSTLIDPEAPFESMNSHIHGLTEVDIQRAPTFGDIADILQGLLADSEVVVAHSAAFDIQVMRASAARYDMELPDFSFACTRVFARRWFPGWPSYALTYCTNQLGIDDALGRDHHNPTWDAEAAAMIARTDPGVQIDLRASGLGSCHLVISPHAAVVVAGARICRTAHSVRLYRRHGEVRGSAVPRRGLRPRAFAARFGRWVIGSRSRRLRLEAA
jgi:DNA polymerase-3 subunit epsilon